jgi:hypothetical protein
LVFQETNRQNRSLVAVLPKDNGTESLLATEEGKLYLYAVE